MSRAPIMKALRKLAHEHAEAARRDVGVRKLREERSIRVFARRKFLHGAGLLVGAAAIARAPIARAANRPTIAILGAGIAGLTAALTLKRSSFDATIYEASDHVGGRMHSETATWRNGQKSEWCGEFIDSDHKTILRLAQHFGLLVVDEIAAQPPGRDDTLYFQGNYYSRAQADADFAPVFSLLRGQYKAAGTTLYNSQTTTGRLLDGLSVYDWIETYVAGGHRSDLGRYLDSAYNQEYGLDTQYQSSLNLVYVLGAQPKTGDWQIYGTSDQRFSIDGGNQRLPEAIAASLPKGRIVTGNALTKIARKGDGYVLTFKTSGAPTTIETDEVILTLPFSVLRGIDYSSAGFDRLKQTAIQVLGYGTNTKLSLQFEQRYWDGTGPWGSGNGNIYTDLFFQNTWDSSRGIGAPGSATGLLTAYMGGSNGAFFTGTSSPYASAATDPAVTTYANGFLGQLERVWPGVSAFWIGRATLSTPWRDPNLLGSYSCWKVGQYTKFAGYEGVAQGACHFAGEHCSTDFQGFMEGAAAEGIRAAKEIIAAHS